MSHVVACSTLNSKELVKTQLNINNIQINRVKMEEQKIKHLEMIQGIITRMNQNSFMLKGWMITIVSALLAIYADKGNVSYLVVTIFPILVFWFIDAYYLQQERKFRGIYSDIVEGKDIHLFKMPIGEYNKKKTVSIHMVMYFGQKQ